MLGHVKRVFGTLVTSLLTLATTTTLAVNVSLDGTGEALIYPYYTVRAGQTTLLSVTNNDARSKAVKVAFREGRNGVYVISFNLFLSPNDTWTAAVLPTANGAQLVTSDSSCTNPRIPQGGVEFRNLAYASDSVVFASLDRTREGYFEIVEMASIVADSSTDLDIRPNATGARACQQVSNAAVAANSPNFIAPSGKLSGNATIVAPSMSTGYDAFALQGLDLPTQVTDSQLEAPSGFTTTRSKTAVITSAKGAGTYTIYADFDRSIDAVSAVLMAESLRGGYSTETALSTDWIVTLPTKRYYANRPADEAISLFTSRWNVATGNACEAAQLTLRNRESSDVAPTTNVTAELCYSTSTFAFQRSTQATPSAIASQLAVQVPIAASAATDAGIAQLSLLPSATAAPSLQSKPSSRIVVIESGAAPRDVFGSISFYGLPAIGFAVASAQFANRSDNYNSSYVLSSNRRIPQQ